ncbi:TetR/AcrR family transcriptional regulator [Aeromicrobium sp. CTD01-1L150]|uniref:TetR/AcrR family transcriptional regulator n=1 Tax=Aeromicrobium sp. CTD01-1L150 TaxID=3341830 RepID=UPI0035C0B531
MPRIVDHDARRREIAAALWRVVRTAGVHDTSVRTVAAEAGWSAGALRHYFPTQEALFAFALQLMTEQTGARVRGLLEHEQGDALERGAQLVEQFLPLDETRRGECLVWYAFADRARLDAVLSDVRESGWHGTRYVARIVTADLTGTDRPAGLRAELADRDAEERAGRLHVLIDGWAVQGISYPDVVTAASLSAQVRAELSQTLPRQT